MDRAGQALAQTLAIRPAIIACHGVSWLPITVAASAYIRRVARYVIGKAPLQQTSKG